MAKRFKVRENQLVGTQDWHGLTHRNHLWNISQEDPYVIIDKVKQLYDVNLEMDEIAFIEKFGTYTVKDRVFRWKLQGDTDKNYPLVAAWEDKAGSIALGTNNTRPGTFGTSFYLDFEDKFFSITEVIVGHKPDKYKIRVVDDPFPVMGIWRFRCELIVSSTEEYIPVSELATGNKFSSEYGLITPTMSSRGFGISHSSPAELQAEVSSFRMEETIPGNMINSGKTRPLKFKFRGPDGKEHLSWISEVEWKFLVKARKTRARLIKYGKSNRFADGTYGNQDKNGFDIQAGSGWKEQWSPANKHTFNLKPDFDHLEQICLDATVGKTANTVFTITAGKWGLRALHKMVQEKLGSVDYKDAAWLQDTLGRAFNWNGNNLDVKLGQFTKVANISGITWIFMEDPTKDSPQRNKVYHPDGGFASSYEYDIMGFGTEDEKANMQIVTVEGEDPVYGIISGLRSPWGNQGSGKNFASARNISTSVDASTMHYMETVGGIVWNPTSVIQYHPDILE